MAKYVDLLFRFRIRFIVLLVLIPIAVGATTVLVFPTYKATADLWADSPTFYGDRFSPTGWSQYLTPAQNQADTLNQLVATNVFIKSLADRLTASKVVTNQAELTQVLVSVATKLKITATGSHLMKLTMTCDKRPVCVQVLASTIDIFREQQATLEKAQAKVGIEFLTSQLADANVSLKTVLDAQARFLAEHPALKADAASASTSSELARLMADVQQATTNVNTLQANLNTVVYQSSASNRIFELGPSVIDAPHISGNGLTGDGTSLQRAAIAAFVCGVIGLGYLFLLSWLDKTTRDVKELERRLKVPVVASIPALAPYKPALDARAQGN